MKKILFLSTSLLLLFFAFNAEARNGIYLTVESGYAKQTNLPSAQSAGALRRENTASFPSAYRASVGYNHDLNCLLGIGLNIGAGRYGRETYYFPGGNTTLYTRTIEFLGVVTLHLRRVDIFGKAGGIRETVITSGVLAQDSQTDSRPEAAIGAAYNLNPHFAVTGTYAYVNGLSKNYNRLTQTHQDPNLQEVLFGLRYTF